METWEALRRSIKSKEHVAKWLRVSVPLVYKWCQPSDDYSDSGAINPLDRVEEIMRASLADNVPPADALAPLHYLNGIFEKELNAERRQPSLAVMYEQIGRVSTEYGALVREVSEALADGKVTPDERRRVEALADRLRHEAQVISCLTKTLADAGA